MKRIVCILIISIISLQLYAQICDEHKIYICGGLGFGVPFTKNNTKVLNNSILNNYSVIHNNASIFVPVIKNAGLHFSVFGVGYLYDITEESIFSKYSNYFLVDKDYLMYGITKVSFLTGIAYKFQLKRFIAMPYFDFGFATNVSPYIDSYMLKEKNSNNIAQVFNLAQVNYKKFDYSYGIDLFYHCRFYWGFFSSIQYDRFSGSSKVTSLIIDNFSKTIETDSFDVRYKSLAFKFGVFFSLFLKDKHLLNEEL